MMNFMQFINNGDLVLDALPDDVIATIEIRDKNLQNLSFGGDLGFEFVISDTQRWLPGSTVRVAFLDGDSDLHRDIMVTTSAITKECGLNFDFGETVDGNFRRWTETDVEYTAEIRVSFNKNGYFSLVGTDSIDKNVGTPFSQVGGRPSQTSLNLGGFAIQRPATWRGTVLHEFLHAVGFHHSHQNMRGPCQAAFRWEDDNGYQATTDNRGGFIVDHNGKRPGVYTYLSGFPNFWSRAKIDHNLKTEENPNIVAGPFDAESVMLYRFPDLFYRSSPSPCAPTGDGQQLSTGDIRGLRLLYPQTAAERSAVTQRQESILQAMDTTDVAAATLESGLDSGQSILEITAAKLRRIPK